MEKNSLTISDNSIRKQLKNYTPEKAILEYIENGLDAWWKIIDIRYQLNEIGGVSELSISDNGDGLPYDKFERAFWLFWDSQKKKNKHLSNTSGKDGVWRLTFFHFAEKARWKTRYFDGSEFKEYDISIKSGTLKDYERSDLLASPADKTGTGTIVTFENLEIDQPFIENDLVSFIIDSIAWRLVLSGSNVYLNDNLVDPRKKIEQTQQFEKTIGEQVFSINFIKWKSSFKEEESRFYFSDGEDTEKFKTPTQFNRWWDDFFHSVYVKWKYFDSFLYRDLQDPKQSTLFAWTTRNQHDEVFIELVKELRELIREIRKPFIETQADDFIKKLEDSWIIPAFGDSIFEKQTKSILVESYKELYLVKPKFLKEQNDEQLQVFTSFMTTIIQEGSSTKIFDILDKVLDLNKEERAKLADILQNIELSNIIKTVQLIEDRWNSLKLIEEIVFNEELGADEVHDLQQLVSWHYWMFGEEYAMLADAEPDFMENLRRFRHHLTGEKLTRKEAYIENDGREKELDILLCKVERIETSGETRVKNVVVELKHPLITLGQRELSQVTKYMDVILSEDRFNWTWFEWRFYLIGNRYDSIIKSYLASGRQHGKDVLLKDPERNYTVYCKTWSDLIEENKSKMTYLKKSLNLSEEYIKFRTRILNKADWIALANNSAVLPWEKSFK